MTAWAYARIPLLNEHLFEAIASQAQATHTEFQGQNLANLLWFFATVPHACEPLFGALASRCVVALDTLGPMELSTVLWACASVGHVSDALFSEGGRRIHRVAGQCESQQLCGIIWANARAAHRHQFVFESVAEEVVERQLSLGPTEVNRLAWAFAFPGRATEGRTGRIGGFRNASLLAHVAAEARVLCRSTQFHVPLLHGPLVA